MSKKNLPELKIGKLPWDPEMAKHQDLKFLRPYIGHDGTITVAVIKFTKGPLGPIAQFEPIEAPGLVREILADRIKFPL